MGDSLSSREQVRGLLSDLNSLDPAVRQTARRDLRALDPDALFTLLADLLKAPGANIYAITYGMVTANAERGVAAIMPLLKDEVADVRWHVCGLVGQYGDEDAVDALCELLLHDESGDVRLLAAHGLGTIGSPRALPVLRRAFNQDQGVDFEGRRVSQGAADAIKRILQRR